MIGMAHSRSGAASRIPRLRGQQLRLRQERSNRQDDVALARTVRDAHNRDDVRQQAVPSIHRHPRCPALPTRPRPRGLQHPHSSGWGSRQLSSRQLDVASEMVRHQLPPGIQTPPFPRWNQDVILEQTGEVFETLREPASKYGLLEREIHKALVNGNECFPYGYSFVYMDD